MGITSATRKARALVDCGDWGGDDDQQLIPAPAFRNSKDVTDVFTVLKNCSTEFNFGGAMVLQLQIILCPVFTLVIAFPSDALSVVTDKASVLSNDASFRHGFHEINEDEDIPIMVLA